ncbi:transposase [Catellatospora sp. NPDC049111]|uniref:transposase n=1 Tax=Catellatospora sp. NPDC049111 TaxID=3155271 RepID=UPI0033F13096
MLLLAGRTQPSPRLLDRALGRGARAGRRQHQRSRRRSDPCAATEPGPARAGTPRRVRWQLYTRRGALVEPGFAQLFQRFGRRLHHRGTAAVDTEIKLLATVHNLNKIFRHDARQRIS